MIPLPSSSPCTTKAMFRTYPEAVQEAALFLQKSVLIAQRPWPPTSFTTMTMKQLFHYTTTVFVALHDEGKVPDVPRPSHEAATVLSTVSSDRPLTLPTMSLTTMTSKQPFMIPLPPPSPSTTKAKYRDSPRGCYSSSNSRFCIAPRPCPHTCRSPR